MVFVDGKMGWWVVGGGSVAVMGWFGLEEPKGGPWACGYQMLKKGVGGGGSLCGRHEAFLWMKGQNGFVWKSSLTKKGIEKKLCALVWRVGLPGRATRKKHNSVCVRRGRCRHRGVLELDMDEILEKSSQLVRYNLQKALQFSL